MALVRDSLYNVASVAVPLMITVITVPYFVAMIGAERYGALAIAWLMLGYFGQADFGIGRAVTQRVAALAPDEKSRSGTIVTSALIAIGGFGVIGGIIVVMAGDWFFSGPFKITEALRSELLESVWMLGLCNLVVALTGVASGSLMGQQRFRLVAASTLISTILMQLAPFAAAWLIGPQLSILIAASLVARLLGLAILAPGVWYATLRGHKLTPDRKEILSLLHFGKWVMVSALISPLMIFADRFAIGVLLGAAAVAAYTIPFQMAARTMLIPGAVVQVMFPRFAAGSESETRSANAFYSRLVANSFAPLIITLICLSEPLLRLWLGSTLDPRSIQIAQILLAGFWINAVANVPYALIQARGDPRFTALLHICELPIYAVLLGTLGWWFGLSGMAAAFGIRCLIDCWALFARTRASRRALIAGLWLPTTLIAISLALHPWLKGWPIPLGAALLLGGLASAAAVISVPAELRSELLTKLHGPLARRRARATDCAPEETPI